MDSHHANLGRQRLEEIRQKRAAERIHKASSGSDLENKNETENTSLSRKLEETVAENDLLVKRLNDVSMEKDAAIIAREDAMAQLRTLKKRCKEAEEEQYRAEEDAAGLRAELNSLQQQAMGRSYGNMSSASEQILGMENEIMELKSELQKELVLRQEEQRKLAEEQHRASTLSAEKQGLEERLADLSKKASDESLEATHKMLSVQGKEKFENQLHEMAMMVERLESSRQKLLMEIDSQSSEIEMLFEENANLSASHKDAVAATEQWENQVRECLKQNEELRSLLDKLRKETVNGSRLSDSSALLYVESEGTTGNMPAPREATPESQFFKNQIIKEQARAESLAAEVMRLSAELKLAAQAHNNLTHLYRPVLRNIENSLMKMKQESFVTIR